MAEYPSSTLALTTTLCRLLDAAGPGVEVKVFGTRVLATLVQELFDHDGLHRGACRVTAEGRRTFGGVVTFESPPRVTVVNALDGEHSEMERLGLLLVEVLTAPVSESPVAAP